MSMLETICAVVIIGLMVYISIIITIMGIRMTKVLEDDRSSQNFFRPYLWVQEILCRLGKVHYTFHGIYVNLKSIEEIVEDNPGTINSLMDFILNLFLLPWVGDSSIFSPIPLYGIS